LKFDIFSALSGAARLSQTPFSVELQLATIFELHVTVVNALPVVSLEEPLQAVTISPSASRNSERTLSFVLLNAIEWFFPPGLDQHVAVRIGLPPN
jgi:hypothetical protein